MDPGGFHGWAQLVADGVKTTQKEDIVPFAADKQIFRFAPALAIVAYLLTLAVVPFGPECYGATVSVSLIWVLAVGGFGTVGTLIAG